MSFRSILLSSLAAAALVATAEAAHANSLTIGTTTGRISPGGEFKVTGYDTYFIPPAAAMTALDGGQFNTFCIEYNEGIGLGSTYDYTVDAGAINGGVSGGNPDLIGEATAKLFYCYWTDQWLAVDATSGLGYGVDFNYENTGGTRGANGNSLQQAIWFLEGEGPNGAPLAYADLNTLAKKYVDFATDSDLTWAKLGTAWVGAGGVMALNLWGDNHSPIQSTLVVVPLPAAAIMGFALLGGMGLFVGVRRRLRDNLS